jgi:Xaa-Pro aminopeptidase
MDTRTSAARLRIARLRETMAQAGLDGVLVPSSDPHLSEYLPAHWQGREWFSGFTGSMGTLVVTAQDAAVFADSRYWVQAEAELAGSGIALEKIQTGAATNHLEWIASHLQPGQTLGVDGQVLGLAAAQQLRATCERAGIALRTGEDPLAAAWDDRPACRPPPSTSTAPRTPPWAARPSWPRCAPAWRRTAPATTSSPRWTTSPGSPICAAPTWPTTPSSWPTC